MSEIIVQRGPAEVPFSRGILARSLLKLGLDSERAYDIASCIHDELRAEGVSVVTTQHLARVLSGRIARHAGEEFGDRYEKLRLFKRSNRPLVLLVGGSTGSGKSTVATEVAHRLDITRIQSTDSVRHVMRSMVSERLLPAVHRSSFEAQLGSHLQPVAGVDPTVAALIEQVRYVSVAIEAVLERAVQENFSTILEGVHLLPGLFQRFAREPRLHFVHLVVYVGDAAAHRQRFVQRGRAAVDRPGARYLEHFDSIRTIQDHLIERAHHAQNPCVENRNLDDAVHAVLGHVLEGVAESAPAVAQRVP